MSLKEKTVTVDQNKRIFWPRRNANPFNKFPTQRHVHYTFPQICKYEWISSSSSVRMTTVKWMSDQTQWCKMLSINRYALDTLSSLPEVSFVFFRLFSCAVKHSFRLNRWRFYNRILKAHEKVSVFDKELVKETGRKVLTSREEARTQSSDRLLASLHKSQVT